MSKTELEMCKCLGEMPKIKKALLSASKIKKTTSYMKLLAHPTRLQILKLLSEKDLCVCVLSKTIGKSQPNISQHLAKLRDTQIIESYPIGKLIFYRIKENDILKLAKNL